ncbi:hypothetical protein BTM_821 [Burkholderia thailandensis 34]|nr:hypothetical protein BTM_821 [Burkholderia thailandensis 34]
MTIARIQSHFAMTRCGRLRPGRSVVTGLLLCEFAPRGVARYPVSVAETTAIRVGSRQIPEADSRLSAVFLRPHTKRLQRWHHSFGQFSEIFKWNVRGNHAADLIAGSVAKYASSGV